MRETRAVLADWRAGLINYAFWWRFGVLDIKLRYRRTLLGPFWVTLSFGISAVALTFVYSMLFRVSAESYFAYLIVGLAVWGLLSTLLIDGCTTFVRYGAIIQEHPLPIFAHALRSVIGNFLVFAHNLIVVALAVALAGVGVRWPMLLAIPAVAVVLLNGVWVAMLLGMLCARFRDLPQLVALLVNIAFLVTPVFWYKHMLAGRARFVDWNPLYAFLEFVRAPLLGQLPPLTSVEVVAVATLAGWLLTFVIARRLQPSLSYWL
jgi:ABC-2 type transport system permease protein/lipopolysaccharide transport system permease protein